MKKLFDFKYPSQASIIDANSSFWHVFTPLIFIKFWYLKNIDFAQKCLNSNEMVLCTKTLKVNLNKLENVLKIEI